MKWQMGRKQRASKQKLPTEKDHSKGHEKEEEPKGDANKKSHEEDQKDPEGFIRARVLKIHEVPSKISVKNTPTCVLDAFGTLNPIIDFQKETEILLIGMIGRGLYGQTGVVWMGVTPDRKRCCAVKFYHRPIFNTMTKSELAQTECDNWNKIYGNNDSNRLHKCHVGHVSGEEHQSYLCMPYIAPVPKHYWSIMAAGELSKMRETLVGALCKFVTAGYKHDSLRMDHLGFFPKSVPPIEGEPQELYIFDLAHLSEFEANEDRGAWVQKAIGSLHNSVTLDFRF